MQGFEQRGDGVGFPCERLCVGDTGAESGNWATSDDCNNVEEMLLAWCTVVEVVRSAQVLGTSQYPEVDPTRAADGPDVGTRGRTVKSDLSFVLSHWRERAAI